MRRNKAPQNAAMQLAQLLKREKEEQDGPTEESHRLDQNLGYLRSTPTEFFDDEDRYKLDTEAATEEDLMDAKARMERLCKNKKLMNRLPDKGLRMNEKLEKVVTALENVLKTRDPGFYKN